MSVAIWGTKVGMTQLFDGDQALPVTVIQVDPNEVVEVKTEEKHGYSALKVACGPRKKKVSKAVAGEYAKADVAARRFLREVPVVDGVEQGGKLTVEALNTDAKCDGWYKQGSRFRWWN